MKTIKVFLASSEELRPERDMMASLANSLNTVLEPQGIQVIVVEWENLDASMGVLHKQEDYNEKLRGCELCIVLYWTKFGIYTKTELDIAYNELLAGNNPKKLYVYFKTCSEATEELKEFKDSFPTKYGHFFTSFENSDTLKAHFLLQFIEYQSQTLHHSKAIEVKDGKIVIGNNEFVNLQNVPFAGNNKEYTTLKEDILELEEDLLEMDPESQRYKKKAAKLKKLKSELKELEESLWDTALAITRLSNKKCNDRLLRAIDCFNQGNNEAANAILNEEEIYSDAQHNLNLIKLGEQGKDGLLINIDELLLKVKLLRPSSRDLKAVNTAYEQISDIMNRIIEYTSIIYGNYSDQVLVYCQRSRLYLVNQPKRQIPFAEKELDIIKNLYPNDNEKIISSYKRFAKIYQRQGDKNLYIEYKEKTIDLTRQVYGEESKEYVKEIIDYATFYTHDNDMTCMMWFNKAISICRSLDDHEMLIHVLSLQLKAFIDNNDLTNAELTASEIKKFSKKEQLFENILLIARTFSLSRFPLKEESYYKEALCIANESNNLDTLAIAKIYYRLASINIRLNNDDNAINFLEKAIELNPEYNVWKVYNRLTTVYLHQNNYQKAIEYAHKCLDVALPSDKYWKDVRTIMLSYRRLCYIYESCYNYEKALEYQLKAVSFAKSTKIIIAIRDAYFELAQLYIKLSQTDEALRIYKTILEEKELTENYKHKVRVLQLMGYAYFLNNDMEKAEKCYKESVELCVHEQPNLEWSTKRVIIDSNNVIATAYEQLAWFYSHGQYNNAQQALDQSYQFIKDSKRPYLRTHNYLQGVIYRGNQEYEKALDVFKSEINNNRNKPYAITVLQNELALTLLKWGKTKEALEITLQLLKNDNNNPLLHKTLGLIYKDLHDYEKANGEFEMCISLMEKLHFHTKFINQVKELINNNND